METLHGVPNAAEVAANKPTFKSDSKDLDKKAVGQVWTGKGRVLTREITNIKGRKCDIITTYESGSKRKSTIDINSEKLFFLIKKATMP